MFKIAICDDDKEICSQIEDIILKHSTGNDFKVEIEVFYGGQTLLNCIEKGHSFDLIYLDIEMDQVSGIEVGRQIRKVMKDHITEIVYISGKDQYDRQLFDVQPLNFIPKPINPSIILENLNLAVTRSRITVDFFEYKKGNRQFKVPIQDIIYFESINRKIKIISIDKEDDFYSTMEEVGVFVSSYDFIRIHRSYLVNYKHVSIFGYDKMTMSNGDVLPISQARRKEIRDKQAAVEE